VMKLFINLTSCELASVNNVLELNLKFQDCKAHSAWASALRRERLALIHAMAFIFPVGNVDGNQVRHFQKAVEQIRVKK
jgi:hypothetical protein